MKRKFVIAEDVIIRGDFASVRIRRYCHLGHKTIICPPYLSSLGITSSGTNADTGGSTPNEARL